MTTAGIGLPWVDAELEAWLRSELDVVERQLGELVASDTDLVDTTARHLLEAGGKRFRPLLTLLAAQYGDRSAPGVVSSALVVELTHLATLYHDDVMDEAPLRRGAPSANTRWTNTVAILTGDYLFARASALVATLGPECVRIQAETFARLVEGQIRETVADPGQQDPLEHYLGVLADKTGSLIATSARFGAMLSGAASEVEEVVTTFGEQIGIAFQLSDDVIDIASDSEQLGKVAGTDLREGIPTLPVLLAQRSTDSADARLLDLLSGDLSDDARHAEVLKLLRAHRAMDEARAEVGRWAEKARSTLEPLPPGPPRDALAALCDLVVTRTS